MYHPLFKAMKEIDIKLPTGWLDLSLDQLKMVARVNIRYADVADRDRYKLFVRINLFFKLGGLSVIRIEQESVDSDDLCYLVLRDSEEFRIRTFQIRYWTEKHLGWLFETPTLVTIPAETMRVQKSRIYHVPPTMMNGFSWRRFRLACDMIEYYAGCSNNMVRLLKQEDPNTTRIARVNKEINLSKAKFLATLFTRENDDSEFSLDRLERYEKDMLQVSDEWFQIILFWWESVMNRLMKIYPRIFSEQGMKSDRVKDPMTVYSRTVATLEKYLSLPEDKLNEETYTNILQHLDDIVRQNEEIENMRRK